MEPTSVRCCTRGGWLEATAPTEVLAFCVPRRFFTTCRYRSRAARRAAALRVQPTACLAFGSGALPAVVAATALGLALAHALLGLLACVPARSTTQ
eukprot:scaffold36143_cov31-Tisochrysis_lutea.AAC.3